MRKAKFVLPLIVGMLLHAAALAGSAADDITISDAYARAVPPGQPNSAAFMVLKNGASSAHAVIAAASSVSKVAELHTHTMANGMMQMRQVSKIDLAPGSETKLQPGGLHVMMIGLQTDLKPGGEVVLTLSFEDGSSKEVKAPVRKIKMKMMKHKMDGMEQGKMKH